MLSDISIRRHLSPLTALALAIVVLALAGCDGSGSGSASDPRPLGKAEFIASADAICQTAEKEREQATKRALGESEGGGSDEAQAFTEAVLQPVIKMTEELAALSPPSRTAGQVSAIVAAFKASAAKLGKTALDSGSASAFAKPDRLAAAFGLTSCAI
jgi:hypothetical protein